MAAKVYGGRWEVVRPLGEGGQAHVYEVKDLRGEHVSEMALKWLKSVKRRDRFIAEAAAGLRLQHENIVKVIDHSTLGTDFDDKERQFLVMPLAAGGSLDRRAALYKESLDSTLIVAEHLASALAHAHANGVIHRDVKPANVLFKGDDHDCLLADFGICLLQDEPRATDVGEAVGPRDFIAPELQGGGQLDVTPAADLYSLGKLIYFMYSGGVVVARERHREPQYNLWHGQGIRSESLGFLLDRLICPLDRRIQKAGDLLAEIRRIRELDHRPGVSPVSPKVQRLVAGLVASQHTERSNQEHNAAVEKAQRERFARCCDSISAWVTQELATQAKGVSTPGGLEVTTETFVAADSLAAGFPDLSKHFTVHRAFGLQVKLAMERRSHSLFFFVATYRRSLFGFSHASAMRVADSDLAVMLVPYYAMGDGRQTHGYLASSPRTRGAPSIHKTLREGGSMLLKSTVEKWPTDQHDYKRVVDDAFEVAIEFIGQTRTGSYSVGP